MALHFSFLDVLKRLKIFSLYSKPIDSLKQVLASILRNSCITHVTTRTDDLKFLTSVIIITLHNKEIYLELMHGHQEV